MKISNRAENMPTSATRVLVPYANAAKERGVKIYHLNIGQPDIETPERFMQAVCEANPKIIKYTNSAGEESYRKKLLKYYENTGISLKLEELIVTTSGSEALRFAMSVCLNEGDEIIIHEPFYSNYNSIAVDASVKVVPINSSIESGFELPSIEKFEEKITGKTKAILLCNPSNPTGKVYSQAELNQLRDLVEKHNLWLISDEVYREFCYGGRKHISAMSLEGIEDRVVMVDSISKRYSACGARLGTIISKNREVMKASLKFAMSRLSSPMLEQVGAEALMDTPKEYFEMVNKEYENRRNTLINELKKIKEVFCPEVYGAFYVMTKLPVEDSMHFCRWMLEEFQNNGETIMLAPGEGFYSEEHRNLGKTQVRIAYILNTTDLQRAVEILKLGLEEYNS